MIKDYKNSNCYISQAKKMSLGLNREDTENILTCFDTLDITVACLATHKKNPYYNMILFKPPKFSHILLIETELQCGKVPLQKEWNFGELRYDCMEQKFTFGYEFTSKNFSVNEMSKFLDILTSESIFDHFLREKLLHRYPYGIEGSSVCTNRHLEFNPENIYRFAEEYGYVINALGDSGSLLGK